MKELNLSKSKSTKKTMAPSHCPICNSDSNFLYSLDSVSMLESLEKYYNEKLPKHIEICDYTILQCKNCSLEFSSPLIPGDLNFYAWITSHSSYYPSNRWEWNPVIKKAVDFDSNLISLLEVGCGSGYFLEQALTNPKISVIGLDSTPASVEKCREKNIEAYCDTIESFSKLEGNQEKLFDLVVAFHCLEHVDNPKEFISSMVSVLKPLGSIFISTPYSPMSFETTWFDPLNHPPHHMTRWNLSAYQELASQFGLKFRISMPPSNNLIRRILLTLHYQLNGPSVSFSKKKMLLTALTHPLTFSSECLAQIKREKIKGEIAADVVLVELYR
jgi:2-polyprenyl-3-methyl-5-hydroxy-6-metoxy-1,4-benzoquinol methylase